MFFFLIVFLKTNSNGNNFQNLQQNYNFLHRKNLLLDLEYHNLFNDKVNEIMYTPQ